MGLLKNIDPIFFYHKSVKTPSARGFDGVVTPSAELNNPFNCHMKASVILETARGSWENQFIHPETHFEEAPLIF